MTRQQEKILKESISYINTHQKSLSDRIPLHLLEQWMEKDEENFTLKQNSLPASVFMYALVKHNEIKGKKEFTIESSKILELYNAWQTTLNVIYLDRITEIKVQPLNVFDFDIYDGLKFNFEMKKNMNF